jgi:hypothetical protein
MRDQEFSAAQTDEKERRNQSWLKWWYFLSLPDEESDAVQGTTVPRGQLASIILLILVIGMIAFIPAALTSDSLHVLPPLIGMFLITCLAIWLNKQGHVTLVGILLVVTFDAALAEALLSYPHFVLTQNAVPIYDMFVLSDIVAISLLPIRSIFFVSSFHSIFMLADIILQPHTPDLQLLIGQTTYSFMVRPLIIQIVVALITFLWVSNTTRALERANKAEIVARLEHTLAMERLILAEGIEQIVHTLVQAANGDLSTRAPLAQQHVLWKVGNGLNMLLTRLERSQQSELELQYTKREVQRLLRALQEAKIHKSPFWLSPGGSDLDLLINELLAFTFSQPSSGGRY